MPSLCASISSSRRTLFSSKCTYSVACRHINQYANPYMSGNPLMSCNDRFYRTSKPQPILAMYAMQRRSFVGNVEYPKIGGTSLDLTKNMLKIGPLLSIPTAPLYLTKPKLEYAITHMKTQEEIQHMQELLLLCDAKCVYPSTYVIGTFINSCLRNDLADTALQFLQQARFLAKYLPGQSLVRVLRHYVKLIEECDEDEAKKEQYETIIDELMAQMDTLEFPISMKYYQFKIENAKRRGDTQRAIQIAKEAADEKAINAYTILKLLEPLDEAENAGKKLQVAKYLVSKGDVFLNEKLEIFLQSASTQDQNLSSSKGQTTTEKMSAEIRRRQKENQASKTTFTESTD
uniref:Uncharacterized protein AlNc14C43G3558 n=1 Tax=Albugo laibachii Nc14 TaxID=890382 RepID=F0WA14_9STRA|nr:conserved hypothetical protein [Albugo laibachii Nc14]CCA27728.1 conserved hypothetical protein [Albugo laibachii Nc14]|eukprot:CCA27728.1 conserved hypothetical protein [Albugo laibachii Nc14]